MITNEKKFINIKINDLNNVSKELINLFKEIKIWLFIGEMGSGKTTLIKSICSQLGVIDYVNSPTYNIVNEYKTIKGENIYHFDFYRLNNYKEALDIGFEEYIDSGSYCFIEWPFKEKIWKDNLSVDIEVNPDKTRNISILYK